MAESSRARPRVSITTLGCKINSFESALLAESFTGLGFDVIAGRGPADVCVINTCTVTREADRQARQEIRRAVRGNPGATVAVTGCYAQMNPAACADIPGVDLVVGNDQKLTLAEMLSTRGEREAAPDQRNDAQTESAALVSGFEGRSRALVQVQQGCDRSCTFCIIHEARGPARSVPPRQVKRQVRHLVQNGYAEIVLTGVDLGSYGADLAAGAAAGYGLTELIDDLHRIPGDFRIRLSSIDPAHVSDALVERLAGAAPRLCPHLHLSMQSANTLILKRMKRRATREMLYERVATLRRRVPELVLCADVLVGFPTETEAQFQETLRAIGELGILFPHVFPYSERDGTPAARIPNQVPVPVRRRRARAVREAAAEVARREMGRFVGGQYRVLLETGNVRVSGVLHGRLANYLPVKVPMPRDRGNPWLDVRITGVESTVLVAAPLAGTIK